MSLSLGSRLGPYQVTALIAVALRRLGDTEVDRITAPIRRAGLDVFRIICASRRAFPSA